jgi:hypothetical protein
MTSAYAAECNRRNAQKSTGPRSPEGKERSRWNALKHGATARLLALPGEDRDELDRERDAWIASRTTDDPVERAILERAFEAWLQLGRTLRAQQGRVEQRMREAELVERRKAWDDAFELGNRLFRDSNGPSQFYPNRPPIVGTTLSSGNDAPGDPDQPARLVLRLESTAAGCRWLLARWNELREILEAGECWLSPERFRAIRLLGKQPLDAIVDRDVRRIFLACHVLRPTTKSPFEDLLREVGDSPLNSQSVFRPALKQLTTGPFTPKSPAEAREVLTSLVDRATSQLEVLLAEHEAREAEQAASPADRHAFDLEHDSELMRRYEASCDRSFHRALTQLRLLRKDAQTNPGRGARKKVVETDQPKLAILMVDHEKETREQPRAEVTHADVPQALVEMSPVAVGPVPPSPAAVDGGFGSASETDPKLRNEPVAASTTCDDLASDTGISAEPDTGNGRNLRNEADAASSDRDDSADRAIPQAPAAVRSMRHDRGRSRAARPAMPVGSKRRLADCVDVRSLASPTRERLR